MSGPFFVNEISRRSSYMVIAIRTLFALLLLPVSAIKAQSEDRESFAVMTVVLDSLYRSQGDHPSMVVVADSLYWRAGGVAYGGKLLVPYASKIDASTISDFEAKTVRSVPFPLAFRYNRLARLNAGDHHAFETRGAEIQRTKSNRELTDMPFWMAFVERFPRAWGISYLSRVGFDKSRSEALIYVRHQCGGGCSSAETILVRKAGSRWRIVERINNGSREGMGIGSLRYLGPGAHFISDLKRQKDSARLAIADSVKRDRAPRRIRGRVINKQTGLSIPFAQIFVHSIRWPGESIRRVVADSRGRYEIRNSPLGGTMLEVQCPGPKHRIGATLDAPGTYVFPAMDTVIDMGPPNIEPCWASRRVHPIESGELASRAYLESSYPSEPEAAVYAAVIDETRPRHGDEPLLIGSDTRSWCGRYRDCPTIHVAHLVRANILDSAIVRDFKAVANDSVPLRPSAFERVSASMFSNGEATYLKQEANRPIAFSEADEGPGFWAGLAQIHPNAKTILSFTRAGFNESGDQALVGLGIRSAADESLEVMALKKTAGKWHVARRHLEDEPITGALVDGKCVPDLPKAPPTLSELASIVGDYDFTLVSSAIDNKARSWRKRFVRDTTGSERQLGGRLDGFGFSFKIRGVSEGQFFGQWSQYSSHFIPIDRDGRAIPQPAGHFCAVRRSAD